MMPEKKIDPNIVESLTYRGVLAYVSTVVLGDGCWSTAQLAQTVNCNSSLMLEGMAELHQTAPNIVGKQTKLKWPVGTGVVSDEGVQILDREAGRRLDFIDDLKRYWDFRNPNVPFSMGAPDGAAINRFLKQHKEWDQTKWLKALRNRAKSEVNHAQPLYLWVGRLAEYSAYPLDRFGKPMMNGVGGRHGETLDIRQRNREAVAAAVAHA